MLIFDRMNKAIIKQLRRAAQKLPPYSVPCKVRVSGSEILNKNPQAKAQNGDPIEDGKFYHVEAMRQQNHYRAMKDIFKKEGRDGVNKYLKDMVDIARQTIKGQSEIAAGMEQRKAALSI